MGSFEFVENHDDLPAGAEFCPEFGIRV
jgi:hypothetical protein